MHDIEAIALRVDVVSDVEFVELTMFKDDFSRRINNHGRVVPNVSIFFYQARAHENENHSHQVA